MAGIPKLTIFISSPGDVYEERTLAQRMVERLQSEYAGRVVLEPIFWEHEPLAATATFQDQIARPGSADVMVSILWSRLGTRLPKNYIRGDGSRYESGTEYEFEDALASFRETGKPHLLVYRNRADEVQFMQLNAVSRLLLDFLREDSGRTGLELLEKVAETIKHPEPAVVVAAGAALLHDLTERDILLGTRKLH